MPSAYRCSTSRLAAALLLNIFMITGAAPTYAAGLFIDAGDRADALYDSARDLVYISTSTGQLLRFDVGSQTFLPSLELSTSALRGISMSPDGSTLAVGDLYFAGDVRGAADVRRARINLVDLNAWTSRSIEFARQRGEVGTFMVEFINDSTIVTTSSYSGSGWVGMRRIDLTTGLVETIASVRQNTMLSVTADRSRVFYTESNSSAGPFGYLDTRSGVFEERSLRYFLFEVAANRDGSQFVVPTYGGMHVYDGDFAEIERIGVYARMLPIGAAYHPSEDILYLAWHGTNDVVQAYDTTTLTPIGVVDDSFTLAWTGNHAFGRGRLRIASDGSGLTVTMDGGVMLYSPISLIDEDPDGDGVINRTDNCPNTPNPDQDDTDGNGTGDACNDFEDADADEWADSLDNCIEVPNDQVDRDGDGLGDACDPFPDTDDHEFAQCEVDRNNALEHVARLEGDLQICLEPAGGDADGDGVADEFDDCLETAASDRVDSRGCSQSQFCESIEIDGWGGLKKCYGAYWSAAQNRSRWKMSCRVRWQATRTCVSAE